MNCSHILSCSHCPWISTKTKSLACNVLRLSLCFWATMHSFTAQNPSPVVSFLDDSSMCQPPSQRIIENWSTGIYGVIINKQFNCFSTVCLKKLARSRRFCFIRDFSIHPTYCLIFSYYRINASYVHIFGMLHNISNQRISHPKVSFNLRCTIKTEYGRSNNKVVDQMRMMGKKEAVVTNPRRRWYMYSLN